MILIKHTKQRQKILDIVQASHQHLSADDVYQLLVKENANIGVATVYRNLKTLYENQLLNRIQHPEYGYLYDANIEHHDHFVCEECGAMFDIERDVKQNNESTLEGHRIHSQTTFYYGVCQDCLKKQTN